MASKPATHPQRHDSVELRTLANPFRNALRWQGLGDSSCVAALLRD